MLINNRTQAEAAFELIRAEIMAGSLLPGAKLNIGALEKRLEVSLGAIREALSRLNAEGLVISEPHRGYRVAPVSSEDLLDLTRTRLEIESLCLSKAMKHGDVEWESRIVAACHKMERLETIPTEAEPRSTPAWNDAHGQFHEALVSACPSAWLLRMRKVLYQQSERYRRLSVPLGTDKRNVHDEHRRLMEAVLRGDEPAVFQELEQHFFATAQIILRSLPQ